MFLLLRWILVSLALFATIHIVPGITPEPNVWALLLAALVLGLLNLLGRPVLFLLKIVTLPLSCLTFGIWSFILGLFFNTLIFYFVGTLNWGFRVNGFWSAVLGALVMSVLGTIVTGILEVGRRAQARRAD